jgi:hypothetical protein
LGEVSVDVRLAAPAQAQPPSPAPVAGLVLLINHGAGMALPVTAANFIRANMPFGTDYS